MRALRLPPELAKARHECPSCFSRATSVAYPEACDYIRGEAFEVVQCKECALAWTSPVPNDLGPYYPHFYRRYNPLVLSTLTFLYRRRVARWCRKLTKVGSALELGCGDGLMLRALRSHGWDVAGTERTEDMARFARENFGLTVYVEPQNPIPREARFNLVVMFQVLEHIEAPVEELQRVAGLLEDDGVVIVGVPNFASWQSRFGRSSWLHLDVPRHLTHFSPQSLAAVAAKAGLEIRAIDYVSLEHDPYGWVQTILNRVFKNRNRLTALLMRAAPWRPGDIVTVLLAALLAPFAVALSLLSWRRGQGALFEALLVKKR